MLEVSLAFLAGLLAGSFLNVCIHRLPRDLSVVRPRSGCPACGHMIAWYDNIPLVSYLLLRGHCRGCGAAIGIRYPVVELLTAILFALSVLGFGLSLLALKYALFGALAVGLTFADLETRILPDEMTLGGLAAGLFFSLAVPFSDGPAHLILPRTLHWRLLGLGEAVFAVLVTAGALWLVGRIYFRLRKREGLGLGDVKMVAMIGSFLGLQPTLLALIIGSVLGSVVGLIYIFATRKDASSYELPFGTFLGAAALLVAWLGEPVLAWYQRFNY